MADERFLSKEERELYELLRKNGWPHEDAFKEATTALRDAAMEDGYDGP